MDTGTLKICWTGILSAPKDWYPQGSNAPAAHNYKDSVLYVTGDPSGSMSILYSDNPKSGEWKATPAILHNLQDPDLFYRRRWQSLYVLGFVQVYPIRGMELDKNHPVPSERRSEGAFQSRHAAPRLGTFR